MELTVVIPTRDRRPILLETLARLERQAGTVDFEVVVVDDGSADGTAAALREGAAERPFPLTLIEECGLGPGAARNRALAVARAPVCLFIDDDCWPRPGLLARHRDFHARRPEREAALLGHIAVAPDPPPTPFMRWIGELHLDFAGIDDPENAGGERFFTGNASVKTALVNEAGGFDESQRPSHEDIDLGLRLERHGMRLAYDPLAAVEHYQPTDLRTAIARMSTVGRSGALLARRHEGRRAPRRPGLRHRVKAAGLTAVAASGVQTPRLQREIWRFLCHEAHREAYWEECAGRTGSSPPAGGAPRIGRTLARLAARDPDTRMPPQAPYG